MFNFINDNNRDIVYALIIFLFFMCFIKPELDNVQGYTETQNSSAEVINERTIEEFKNKVSLSLHDNKCSTNCCGHSTLYKSAFVDTKDHNGIKISDVGKGKKYRATNMGCSGHHGTGCVCMTKEQAELMSRRGNNA